MNTAVTQVGRRFALSSILLSAGLCAMAADPIQTNQIKLKVGGHFLRLVAYSPSIVRVTIAPTGVFPPDNHLSVIAAPSSVRFQKVTMSPDRIVAETSRLRVLIDRSSGSVKFTTLDGKNLLSEHAGEKSLRPTTFPNWQNYKVYASHDAFDLPADESIYGLGQHQQGFLDYRGSVVRLEQHNMEVAVPFLVSSRGYGLLWDNPASTVVNVDGPDETKTIPTSALQDQDGQPGLTAEYYDGVNFDHLVGKQNDAQVDHVWTDDPPKGLSKNYYSVRWTGTIDAPRAGRYSFRTIADDGARLFIDDVKVVDDWSIHAPRPADGQVQLTAGRHKLRIEYFQGGGGAEVHLQWAIPLPKHPALVSWNSEAAQSIDYYFVYGPEIDRVISGYRDLTGQAPLFGKWAYGYWQSKERYNTQAEWHEILHEYRARKEPIDNIVQDWFYWNPYPWGSDWFDAKRYPDPAQGVAELHHRDHAHIMISVWGRFDTPDAGDPAGANYRAMNDAGFLYPGLNYYDAFNPAARDLYWQFMDRAFYKRGFDAWWLDASEPEVDMQAFRTTKTAAGPGFSVLNAWPLEHTAGVYQHQRHETDQKRVFILTRSAYAGQQRNSAATWSGDITASWPTLRKQIPAGLNFCLSGIPYWTTDIGAFFVPPSDYPGGANNIAYQELFTRWFEYGAFCPIFRAHGTNTPREIWRFGPDEKILAKYDRLRYRLMPYIYSQAWQITHSGGTLMRALVMDFREDPVARELKDEFMFGPALLVAPVTEPGAKSRKLYLPKGASWTNFWSGQTFSGGQWITTPAPIETLPLFVRSGSIVPLGPDIQYAAEKAADPIELRIYPGESRPYTLFDDDETTYAYERGRYSTVEIARFGKTIVLTPGENYLDGKPRSTTFNVVYVKPGHGVGVELAKPDDRTQISKVAK
jgi:alpha-D-xyloside xylohydrolase